MSEQSQPLTVKDPTASSCSFGSDDGVAVYQSSGVRPPKKRRFYLPPKKPEITESPPVLPSTADDAQLPSPLDIDLDALTYYPAYESAFEGTHNESTQSTFVPVPAEPSVVRSEKSMKTAIRQIAKQRRRIPRALF